MAVVGDYVDFQNGYAFKSKDFCENGDYNVIKIKELKDGKIKITSDTAMVKYMKDIEKYVVDDGDILFALTGDPISKPNPLSWVGRVSMYRGKESAVINQRVCKVIPKYGLNPLYLYYFFRNNSEFYQLAAKATGSASQANISTKTISDTYINLPNIEYQNKVVGILSSLDEKIEINNKINDNLQEQAHAIFRSWFVDYAPFGGSAPSDWFTSTLGRVCSCELGGTPSRAKAEYWNGNIPWINSGEVNLFRITKPSETITELGLSKSATKLLPAKTTVIAITGATLGQISLLEIESCANQSVVGVVPNEQMPYEFIYPFISNNIEKLISHQTGGAQQHINKQNVEGLSIIVPSKAIMNDYVDLVRGYYSSIANNCFENERLAELRDTLLPRLMSGELDVSNIDL